MLKNYTKGRLIMTIRKFENEQEAKLYIELKRLFKKEITSNVREVMSHYPNLSQGNKDVVYEIAYKDYFENKWDGWF